MPSYHERREWWNSERVATLTDLACSTAARHIADILGTTRNAVLGKAHRLGLTLRRDNQGEGDRRHYSPERRRERFLRNRELELARNRARYARQQLEHGHVVQPRPCITGPYVPRPPVVHFDTPPPLNITFDQLTLSSCRWPITGSETSTCYCGHCSIPGRSYCAAHHHIAYNYVNERRANK